MTNSEPHVTCTNCNCIVPVPRQVFVGEDEAVEIMLSAYGSHLQIHREGLLAAYRALLAAGVIRNGGQAGVGEWHLIETAPKDAIILVYRPTAPEWMQVAPAKWEEQKYARKPEPYWANWLKIGDGATESRRHPPTHWMPLPAPPVTKEG